MRALVVHYSRSGMTRAAAHEIARALGADIEELRDSSERRGALGYVRSTFAATVGRAARLAPLHHDPRDYDVVVVGTPVWAASVSTPVRTFLARYAGELGELAFFVTEGGHGTAQHVFRQMTDVSSCRPVARLVLSDDEVRRGGMSAGMRTFVDAVREAARSAPSVPPTAPLPHA